MDLWGDRGSAVAVKAGMVVLRPAGTGKDSFHSWLRTKASEQQALADLAAVF